MSGGFPKLKAIPLGVALLNQDSIPHRAIHINPFIQL